jgi:eukaryotic-like serine/threonine-protein kinase
MKPKNLLIAFSLLILAASLSSCAGGTALASSWPGVTVDENTAYVAYHTHVYAVDLSTGTERWRYPGEPNNQITFYAAPALTPNGQVIVGSYDSNLYSLNRENGQLNWSFTEAANRYIGGPLATESGIFAPDTDLSIYALDFQGNLLWSFAARGETWAPPATDDGSIYVSSMDHTLYALNAETGSQLWRTEPLGGAIVGAPALSEEGILYVGTFGSEIIALNQQDGRVIWQQPTDGWVWAGPTLADNRLYFGDLSGNFYAFTKEGIKEWQLTPEQLDGPIPESPLVSEGRIYVTTENGTLYSIDTNGTIVWSQTVGGRLYASPVEAGELILVAPIDTDALLVAYTRDGARRWAFNPEG